MPSLPLNDLINSANYRVNKNTGNSNSYSKDDEIHVILKEMYQNAQAWHSASTSKRSELDARNLQLGSELNSLGIDATRKGGTWYSGNELLFEKYKKYIYHKGGIAGDDGTLKDNEILAKLEKGEPVLTEQMWENLTTMIDRMERLSSSMGDLPVYVGQAAFDDNLMRVGGGTVNNVTTSNQPVNGCRSM